MSPIKKNIYRFIACFSLLCLGIQGCSAGDNPAAPTIFEIPSSSLATATSYQQPEPSAFPPTPTPIRLVIEPETLAASSKEAEVALLDMLKTNGGCTGKCVAGIRPDEMTVQEAVNKMAQWGAIRIGRNFRGDTFINLIEDPLSYQLEVRLSIGTWTNELETIDEVSMLVGNNAWPEETDFVNEDIMRSFHLGSLLKSYGVPSFVGFFFEEDVTDDSKLYYPSFYIQYAQYNLKISKFALAYLDGADLFLCPSKSASHSLNIVINPEVPLEQYQNGLDTWEELSGTDLNTFYEMYTDEANPDVCISVSVK